MSVSSRELWTVLHGLIFGSLFLGWRAAGGACRSRERFSQAPQ